MDLGESATFEAYTTTREIEHAYVSTRTTSGTMIEWYPVDGADQYRVNDVTTNQAYFVTEPQIWVNMDAGSTHDFVVSENLSKVSDFRLRTETFMYSHCLLLNSTINILIYYSAQKGA